MCFFFIATAFLLKSRFFSADTFNTTINTDNTDHVVPQILEGKKNDGIN